MALPAPQTGGAYQRAREICERLGEIRELFPVLYGLWLFHLYGADLNSARAASDHLLELAWARSCSKSSSRASARYWYSMPTGGASRSTLTTSIGSSRRRVADPVRGDELLLAREIDVLQSPPADQLERIAATPGLKVQTAESNQTLYLGFDEASPELGSSNVKGRNPFADRRVRQAFYQGIDIRRIIEALHGLAVPSGMLIWPKGIGWAEELDRRPPHDPDKAKALLAEAGYPEGFDVRFDCPAYREPICSMTGASL